jgi:hypothetical protein
MFVRRASRILAPVLTMGVATSFGCAHAAASAEDDELFVVRSALSAVEYRPFPVTHVSTTEDGSHRVRFALPSRNDELGLEVASSLEAQAKIDGERQSSRPSLEDRCD